MAEDLQESPVAGPLPLDHHHPIRRLRSIRTATISAVAVLVGMWLERYLIIVPTLATPRLASAWGSYAPTWVEISITVATFAAMTLLYLIFSKLFPIIAVWEYHHVSDG